MVYVHHIIGFIIQFTVKPPTQVRKNTNIVCIFSQQVYTEAKLAKSVRYGRIDFEQDKTIDDRNSHHYNNYNNYNWNNNINEFFF